MMGLAFRLHRWGIVGYGGFMAFNAALNGAAFLQVAGNTPAQRQALAHSMAILGPAFRWITPPPLRVDSLGGYLDWRALALAPVILGLWGVLAGTGVTRGDDERHLLEHWLGAGVPRRGLVMARMGGFGLAVAAALAIGGMPVVGLSWLTGEPVSVAGLAAESLSLGLVALVFFALGMLCGQLWPTRRAAAGAAAGVLVSAFVWSSLVRLHPGLEFLDWLSPLAVGGRTRSLVPGGAVDWGGILALLVIAAGLATLAAVAFQRRDLSNTLFAGRRRPRLPSRTPPDSSLFRFPIAVRLYQQRLGLAAWSVGLVAWALLWVQLVRPLVQLSRDALAMSGPGSPDMVRILTGSGHGTLFEGTVGFGWFGGLACALLAAYAITEVARWAREEESGQLEATLSAPISRWRVMAHRAVALGLGALALIVAGHLAIVVGTRLDGIVLDPGRLTLASLTLLPVALSFGAAGAALVAYGPRVAVVALSILAVLSYLDPYFAPVFKAPAWLVKLSVFNLYGSPLADGPYWPGLVAMAVIMAVGFAAAMAGMSRHDLRR